MADYRALRRGLLCTLIGALALAGLIGIYVFVLGDFGETEMKILVTTLSLTFFSVTSLGCTAVLERKSGAILGLPGLAVSLLGFVSSLAIIWSEWGSEPMFKTMAILAIFAFSLAQACLLALPRLKARLRWLFAGALACIFSLALLISVMVIFEWDDELLFRLAGVLGILDACATLTIPILYKVTGPAALKPDRLTETAGHGDLRIELSCPRCGRAGVYPLGTIDCPECSLRISVEVTDPTGLQQAGRRRSGRFQFGLKAMLLVFVVASLPLGWIGYRVRQLQQQAAVIAALAPLNPQVYYTYGNATHLNVITPDPSRFDASLLARLKELPKLQSLYLENVPITDDDVVYLERLDVQWVCLQGTQLTPAAIERLKRMRPNWKIEGTRGPTGAPKKPSAETTER